MSNYKNPVKVIYSENWFDELGQLFDQLNMSNPIIVTSNGNRERLNLSSIFPEFEIFSNVKSNPNFNDCSKILKLCNENN